MQNQYYNIKDGFERRPVSSQRARRNSYSFNNSSKRQPSQISESFDVIQKIYNPQRTITMSIEQRDKRFADHFQKVMSNNKGYFSHILGECKCGKGTCSRCQCATRGLQIDSSNCIKSLYQRDFRNQKTKIPLPFILDNDDFKGPEGGMDMRTTNRVDFTPKRLVQEEQVNRTSLRCGGQILDSSTMYSSNFNSKIPVQNVLFTHEAIENFRVPHQRIKQLGNTEAQSQFCSHKGQDNRVEAINFALDRSRHLKPPISMDNKMDLNTTQRMDYKDFLSKSKEKKNTKTPVKAFDPYNRDFIRKKNTWVSYLVESDMQKRDIEISS